MRNISDGQQQKISQGRANNGFLPSSFRAFSSYLRIVSSGASTVAKSAASVVQSIVDRDEDVNYDQVQWAGFDKLEDEGDVVRRVLLLGSQSGFQVWDVEEADNVHDLVSRHDGPVWFMQLLPKPQASNKLEDKFMENRPILVICTDGTLSGASNMVDGFAGRCNGSNPNCRDSSNGSFAPTVVQFYSLRSQSYVHMLKFRSVVYSVRCSSRIVAISQAAQIHCFLATTFEREYTILTNPVVTSNPGSVGLGYGPLAVGPRWLAYSGSPIAVSNSGRVSPQHLTTSASFSGFSSNGSLVAHYAKESSKQLAAGIVSLGDIGYKKLTRYYSELRPDPHGSSQSWSPGWKGSNGHLPDTDNAGMVVVRDIVSKLVIAQFRAHKSPISALCFDPSGTLLVTASVHGHNINVFKIMPGSQGSSSTGDAGASYTHLYRLQRGFTNAVIQDISFSVDSNWIMISSSRGTNHLFAINPFGGSVNFQTSDVSYATKNSRLGGMTKSAAVHRPATVSSQMHNQQNLCAAGPPVTLSVVSRIRNGNNGWRGTVTGAAAAATGRFNPLSGAIASSFHNCKGNNDSFLDGTNMKTKYHLLVFSPSGCMIQYVLRISAGLDSTVVPGAGTIYESVPESDERLVVEAIQKWNICHKHNRRDGEDDVDIYGENGNLDSNKVYPEGKKKGNKGKGAAAVISPEENNNLYISEAELQMHLPQIPLWAKHEICFQSMVTEGIKVEAENAMLGEVEVERIPTRTIEARSKDLVPVFDYLRVPVLDSNMNRHMQHQRCLPSENWRVSHRSNCGSLDSMPAYGGLTTELENGVEANGWNGPRTPIGTMGFVNNCDSPQTNTQLENV